MKFIEIRMHHYFRFPTQGHSFLPSNEELAYAFWRRHMDFKRLEVSDCFCKVMRWALPEAEVGSRGSDFPIPFSIGGLPGTRICHRRVGHVGEGATSLDFIGLSKAVAVPGSCTCPLCALKNITITALLPSQERLHMHPVINHLVPMGEMFEILSFGAGLGISKGPRHLKSQTVDQVKFSLARLEMHTQELYIYI